MILLFSYRQSSMCFRLFVPYLPQTNFYTAVSRLFNMRRNAENTNTRVDYVLCAQAHTYTIPRRFQFNGAHQNSLTTVGAQRDESNRVFCVRSAFASVLYFRF